MFHYYEPPGTFDAEKAHAHVTMIPAGLCDTRELMTVLGRALRFPGYYGRNLDAFWDCVRELENIPERRIMLVHHDMPALTEEKGAAYIELLRDTVLYWEKHRDEHCFEVWFPLSCKPAIEKRLAKLPPAIIE